MGSLGPEPNYPNTIDDCTGEAANQTSVVRFDESVDRIAVRATDGGDITAGEEVAVEVTLSSAGDTSERAAPGKWSVAHFYHAPNVNPANDGGGNITWTFVKSVVVEPGSGRNTFTFRFDLPPASGGSSSFSSAIRVSYGYNQYGERPCASDGVEDASYLDVDDLVFEVAAFDTPYDDDDLTVPPSFAPTSEGSSSTSSASDQGSARWIIALFFATPLLGVALFA